MIPFRYKADEIPYRDKNAVIDNIYNMIQYIELGLSKDLGKGDLDIFSRKHLEYLKNQLIRVINYFNEEIDILSWIARNIYELRLIMNYYLSSHDLLTEYILLPVKEYSEIEKIMFKDDKNVSLEEMKIYKEQMVRLNDFVKKNELIIGNVRSPRDLANRVGISDTYDLMFKLPSKYVHPSPLYFFGHPQYVHGDNSRHAILVAIQFSAGHLLIEIPGKIEALRMEQLSQ